MDNKQEFLIKLHENLLDKYVDTDKYEIITEILNEIEDLLPSSHVEDVLKFHKAFHHPIGDYPVIENSVEDLQNKDISKNRIKFIQEEIDEYKTAIKQNNTIEVIDALVDILYFTYGTLIIHGLHTKLDECFNEIHKSNMSKLCYTIEEVNRTIDFYNNQKIDCIYNKHDNYYVVMNKETKKILKSINYCPPNLYHILIEY